MRMKTHTLANVDIPLEGRRRQAAFASLIKRRYANDANFNALVSSIDEFAAWQKYIDGEWLESEPAPSQAPAPCTCPTSQIVAGGCTCGAMQKERGVPGQ